MKPLLIGLHNPYSPLPKLALVPYPPGSTGARMLDMLQLADPAFDADRYLESFDRVNVWKGQELPTGRGSMNLLLREGRRIYRDVLAHRRVAVILGSKAWAAVMNRTPPDWFTEHAVRESRVWYVPHPSGLSRIYNDERLRRKSGELLASLSQPRLIAIGD